MNGWLSAAVTTLALLAGIGAAATWLTVGRQKGRVLLLETRAADLQHEIDDLDRRNTRLEAQGKADQATIHSLEQQIAALQLLKSGEAALRRVDAHITELRDESRLAFADIKAMVGDRR